MSAADGKRPERRLLTVPEACVVVVAIACVAALAITSMEHITPCRPPHANVRPMDDEAGVIHMAEAVPCMGHCFPRVTCDDLASMDLSEWNRLYRQNPCVRTIPPCANIKAGVCLSNLVDTLPAPMGAE